MNLLHTEIVSDIKQKIDNEEFKVGEKLPSERELSTKYNVSRNVVRESIGVLRENGMITVHAGKGAYVTKPDPDMIADILERVMKNYDASIEEILEVREELEKIIVKKVVRAAKKEDIEYMYDLYQQMEFKRKKMDIETFTKLDEDLHKLFAKSTNNPIYLLLLSSFIDLTQKILFKTTVMFPESIVEAQNQHIALIKAIENRDEELAENLIVTHMQVIRDEIKELRGKGLI